MTLSMILVFKIVKIIHIFVIYDISNNIFQNTVESFYKLIMLT